MIPCGEFQTTNPCILCWRQEYVPPAPPFESTESKTYEDGLKDTREFARFLLQSEDFGGISYEDFQEAYGPGDVTPEEAICDLDYEDQTIDELYSQLTAENKAQAKQYMLFLLSQQPQEALDV